jgi:ABC-type transport system involved in multi-copper enzyme maturation permease subunit
MASVEATKALRQPATYVLLGILAAYVVLIVIAFASILAAPQGAGLDPAALLAPLRADAVGFVASLAVSIGTLTLVVFAAQSVAQEFTRGTLRTLLLARAQRIDVALAKVALLAAAALLLALLAVAAGVGGAAVFGMVSGETLLKTTPRDVAILLVRAWALLLGWALIALGTTLGSRSLGVGLGSTLGALVAGDILRSLLAGLGQAGVWASRALPNAALSALGPGGHVGASDWGWIAPNLLVWVVALNVLAVRSLLRLDIISATK